MKRRENQLAFALNCLASIALAYLGVEHFGLELARASLRYAFGPAVVLAGFAFNLLGKVPDLAEMKGIPLSVVERLAPRIAVVQLRLWLIICAVTASTVIGWIVSSLDSTYVQLHAWPKLATIACLSIMFAATIIALFYLPLLHMDYTRFRMRAVRDLREKEDREEAVKRLKE